MEGLDFSIIVDLLFSSQDEGYVNFHSLVLIIGMMIIVQISHEAGTFQFLAIRLIKLSRGKPVLLFILFCIITILISAILNNILSVIILIPLTITVSRILNINPSPYILTQAVLVNIGGTFFSISSIPNILITTYAGISFVEFFLNVGLISLIIFPFTTLFFIFLFKKELSFPEEGFEVLKEFNIWNFVQNKRLLFQSIISIITLIILFIFVPSSLITSDMIALSIAIILIIISGLDPKELIKKIDFELIFYLLGIFIISGGLEITGIVSSFGIILSNLGAGNLFLQIIIVLWISAFLSSSIDNIPITKVLIPVIGSMSEGVSLIDKNQLFYSLSIGANWGDNLTPLGDNILVINLAEQNNRPISFKQFFKLGFCTTIYQLIIVTIYFTLIFQFIIGMVIIITISIMIAIFYLLQKYGPNRMKIKIDKIITKFKNIIIK